MFKGKKILCVIPARKNSQGLKNKNIQKIKNKPLIFFPISAALKSKYIDKIYVNSDSKEILKIAKTARRKFAKVKTIEFGAVQSNDKLVDLDKI